VIHDVNKKNIVVSDLNFAIDAAFRHHKIDIAFPQIDIHIKDHLVVKPG
jgi:small-conductance mechanosensitive channel